MLTTLFSTHGFQRFSFSFTQHNATLESHQQQTESTETRPFKTTNTSFKTLLNKIHPNISKCGMDNIFKGATLVLALTLKTHSYIESCFNSNINHTTINLRATVTKTMS